MSEPTYSYKLFDLDPTPLRKCYMLEDALDADRFTVDRQSRCFTIKELLWHLDALHGLSYDS